MVRKKRLAKNFNISNRLSYTLIAVVALILLGTGIYAYGTSNPSVFGHSAGELDLSGGVNGNVLFNDNVTASGFCIGNSCINRWFESEVTTPPGTSFVWKSITVQAETGTDETDSYGLSSCDSRREYGDTCNGDRNVQYLCPNGVNSDCQDSYLSATCFRKVQCRSVPITGLQTITYLSYQ